MASLTRFLSGALGLLLAVLYGLVLIGNLPGFSSLNPSMMVLGAGFCLTLWSLLTRGRKHPPYWITLAGAVGLIIWSLSSGAVTGNLDAALSLTGFGLIITGRIISTRLTLNARRYYTVAGLLTLIAVLTVGVLLPVENAYADLSYIEGKAALTALLHPGAGEYIEDIDDYVDDLMEDETLDPSAKEEEIIALNRRIAAMEAELVLFEAIREENSDNRREIAVLERRVKEAMDKVSEIESRPGESGDIIVRVDGKELQRVADIKQAVRPDIPMVRDFAAALASENPGSYYRGKSYGNPSPGSIGVKQIITIHRYISGNWKYVNDPMFVSRDYYSPAHRTIAAGLAGDCDDYAVLIAACIEAVGGKTRIMAGSCAEGGHAWPEVYIGGKDTWNEAMREIGSAYPGRTIQYLTDSSGEYWLCLDWQLGHYSCGGSAHVIYQSDRR